MDNERLPELNVYTCGGTYHGTGTAEDADVLDPFSS